MSIPRFTRTLNNFCQVSMKKQVPIALCVFTLAVGVLAIGRQNKLSTSVANFCERLANHERLPVKEALSVRAESQSPPSAKVDVISPGDIDIPVEVRYGLLFREIEAFKKKADEMDQAGKDGSSLRIYHQARYHLDQRQTEALDQIAADCQRTIVELDRAAKRIIDAEKARHPFGRLKRGEALPAPPAELNNLEQRRKNATLEARDRIRSVLGDAAFQRFDDLQRSDAAERIKPIVRGPHQVRIHPR